MAFNIANEDLRNIKTKKALYTALFSLLKSFSFKKLTIKEICEEALISRAAFYTHFIDKYDLLRHWIPELLPMELISTDTYEEMERELNLHIQENIPIIRNLFYNADSETYNVLFDFILSAINLNIGKNSGEANQKDIVLSNFFAGGIISYLSWQVKNRFPQDVPAMNRYLYDIIQGLRNWQDDVDHP